MSNTINQPTMNPTNKLTASTAALAAWGVIMSIGGLALQNLYPTWYDADVMLQVSAGVPTIVGFLAGYFTRDKPNIVVVMEDKANV